MPSKTHLTIEETGGFVGASSTSHFHTRGKVDVEDLPEAERTKVEQLLKRGSDAPPGPEPRYSLSWEEGGEVHRITVNRSELPDCLLNSLKTELD